MAKLFLFQVIKLETTLLQAFVLTLECLSSLDRTLSKGSAEVLPFPVKVVELVPDD